MSNKTVVALLEEALALLREPCTPFPPPTQPTPDLPSKEEVLPYDYGTPEIGEVVFVTNLEDSGSGSLREAIDRRGPRTVMFDVTGRIVLGRSIPTSSHLRILGQTAPWDGVIVSTSPSYPYTPFKFGGSTSNVRLEHFSIRPGPASKENNNQNPFDVTGTANNIVFHRCAFGHATDQCGAVWGKCHDIVFYGCIFSEGMHRSTHAESGKRQEHAMGLITGGDKDLRRVSVIRCLFHGMNNRSPYLCADEGVVAGCLVSVAGARGMQIFARHSGLMRMAMIDNHVLHVGNRGRTWGSANIGEAGGTLELYMEGNTSTLGDDGFRNGGGKPLTGNESFFVSSPAFTLPSYQTLGKDGVIEWMKINVGPVTRNAWDRRAIDETINQTAIIRDAVSETEVATPENEGAKYNSGGWPNLKVGPLKIDRSKPDGIPDWFRSLYGLPSGDLRQHEVEGINAVNLFAWYMGKSK